MQKLCRHQIAESYKALEDWLLKLDIDFYNSGETIFKSRNEVRVFNVGGLLLNVKSFKLPNLLNRFAYVYLRPSKAARSYSYARYFAQLGIATPEAVGYLECRENGVLKNSYYVSLHDPYDYTLREVLNYRIKDREVIIRKWVDFTYNHLHKNGIFHLDYSPGNTLITERNGEYIFKVIDLNRMKFCKIDLEKGLSNFRQLDTNHATLELIAVQYANLRGGDPVKAVRLLESMDAANKRKRHGKAKFKNFVKSMFKYGRGDE